MRPFERVDEFLKLIIGTGIVITVTWKNIFWIFDEVYIYVYILL